jgi:O-acetyl-ADP-ribose deacetylase (regulator of RNase III)
MLKYIEQDATEILSGIIAHGVNCQHRMASGIAKTIRRKFPIAYQTYMNNPKGKEMLGTAHIVCVDEEADLHVANIYTQVFYGYGGGRYADLDAIERGMIFVGSIAEGYQLNIYMPRIGCGLGGLSWDKEVGPLMERVADVFSTIDIHVCDLPSKKEDKTHEFITY